LFLGWPVSWGEWDVLFLIPWPWLGPWIAAGAIAALFVGWGGLVLSDAGRRDFPRLSRALVIVGALTALTAFLQPGWGLLAQGRDAWQGYTPGRFWWEVFVVGYLAMAAGLLTALRPALESTRRPRRRRVRGARRFRV
ncbi:MAG: hypothetical protein HY942_06890, partial [Gammaproteobacteria bacterium]|nr:hypothetical protein [Gammaproteobacteria bacterium]